MFPHIRFAAFLVAKKKPLTIIRDLPVPEPGDIARSFPNIKGTKKWFEFSGTQALADNTPDARAAYTLWGNKQTRLFLYVAILRNLEPFDILKKQFRIEVSKDAFDLYKRVFFDITEWDKIDLTVYMEKLSGEDKQILEACLSTSETEFILNELGLIVDSFEHVAFLNNMFMKSYRKFMKEERLEYGRLALQIEKRISEVSQMTKRDVLKELNLELEGIQSWTLSLDPDEPSL